MALLRSSVESFSATHGEDHPDTASARSKLAAALAARGAAVEVLAQAEQAWVFYEAQSSTADRGESAFRLARALWRLRREQAPARGDRKTRALALAQRALPDLTAAGKPERVAVVRGWIAARR